MNSSLAKILDSENYEYFEKLYRLYNVSTSYKSIAKKYAQIDNTLNKYVGTKENLFKNDYDSLWLYFFKLQEAEINKLKSNASPKYNAFFGNSDFSSLPSGVFYLLYLANLNKILKDEEKNHTTLYNRIENQKDFGKLTDEEFEIFNNINNTYLKWKLLISLFDQAGMPEAYINPIISAFDSENLSYIDDDLEKLNTAAKIKHRYMEALRDGQKIEVYKLLGLLYSRKKDLDSGECEYLEAVARFRDGDYEGAIRYADKLKNSDIDYGASLSLKLECFSKLGDIRAFLDSLQNGFGKSEKSTSSFEVSINSFYLTFLIAQLLLNCSDNDLDDFYTNFEDYIEICQNCRIKSDVDLTYVGKCRRLTAKIVEEFFEIVEQDRLSSQLTANFVPTAKSEKRKLKLCCALDNLESLKEENLKAIHDFVANLDLEKYDDLKKSLCEDVCTSLIDRMPRTNTSEDLENICCAFVFLYKTGSIEGFLNSVTEHLNLFKQGVKHPGIIEILQLAYVEFEKLGQQNQALADIVNEYCVVSEETVKSAKVKNMLSPQGEKAYEFALWQYEQSQKEDYGWKDAGLISLAFYRILELEINTKIINPLISKISITDINQKFQTHRNSLTGDDKKNYGRRWSKIIDLFEKGAAADPEYKGFLLGNLCYLFTNLTSEFDANDPLSVYLKTKMEEVCDYTAADIAEVISHDNREKYRNPPAHTSYLPYSVARECKTFVEDALIKIHNNMVK